MSGLRLSVVALATLTAAVLVVTAGPALSAGGAGAGGTVVATVVTASGGHLSVQRKAGGTPSALRAGASIYYGDVVLAGPGASATFRVAVARGTLADKDLLYVRPVAGAHHALRMERFTGYVLVTLGPATGR